MRLRAHGGEIVHKRHAAACRAGNHRREYYQRHHLRVYGIEISTRIFGLWHGNGREPIFPNGKPLARNRSRARSPTAECQPKAHVIGHGGIVPNSAGRFASRWLAGPEAARA